MVRKLFVLMGILGVLTVTPLTPSASGSIIQKNENIYVGNPGEDFFYSLDPRGARLAFHNNSSGSGPTSQIGDVYYGFMSVEEVAIDGATSISVGSDRIVFLFAFEVLNRPSTGLFDLGAVTHPGQSLKDKLDPAFGNLVTSETLLVALSSNTETSFPYSDTTKYNNTGGNGLSTFKPDLWGFEFSAGLTGGDTFAQAVALSGESPNNPTFTLGLSVLRETLSGWFDTTVEGYKWHDGDREPTTNTEIVQFALFGRGLGGDYTGFSFAPNDIGGWIWSSQNGVAGFDVVPEPGTFLVWCGLLGCVGAYRIRRKRGEKNGKS